VPFTPQQSANPGPKPVGIMPVVQQGINRAQTSDRTGMSVGGATNMSYRSDADMGTRVGGAVNGYVNDPFNLALRRNTDFYGIENAAFDRNAARLSGQLGQISAGYGQMAGSARTGYGLDMKLIDIARKGQGIDYDAIRRQQEYYRKTFGIQDTGFNEKYAFLGQNRGFARDAFRSQLEGLDAQGLQVGEQTRRSLSALTGDAAARGALVAGGTQEKASDVATDERFARDSLARQRSDADLAFRKEDAGLKFQQEEVLRDKELNGLNTNEQIARLNDRQRQLDLEAAKLGVQADQLANNLQSTLARLNLDRVTSVGQIMDSLASNDLNRAQMARSIVQQSYQEARAGG
jgi:hypothetical protein